MMPSVSVSSKVVQKALTAAKCGDLKVLENISKARSLHDSVVDDYGASCVHYGARSNNVAVLELLICRLGLSASKRTCVGATPLHDAAASGSLHTLRWLLGEAGAQVDEEDDFGLTAVHLAAKYGHSYVLNWLLEETCCDIMKRSTSGALPLHFAVVGGCLQAVKLLIKEAPRSVNMQMNNGATPSYLASQECKLDILKYLVIEAKGSLKITAFDGMSCLHAAAQMGHLDIITWLVQEAHCNPNERDFDGATPLHFAASCGQTKVVEWLLQVGGANITIDRTKSTPLHNAAEIGQLQCVLILLRNNCDPNLRDNVGQTAADVADRCCQTECAKAIREYPYKPVSNENNHNNNNVPLVSNLKRCLPKRNSSSYKRHSFPEPLKQSHIPPPPPPPAVSTYWKSSIDPPPSYRHSTCVSFNSSSNSPSSHTADSSSASICSGTSLPVNSVTLPATAVRSLPSQTSSTPPSPPGSLNFQLPPQVESFPTPSTKSTSSSISSPGNSSILNVAEDTDQDRELSTFSPGKKKKVPQLTAASSDCHSRPVEGSEDFYSWSSQGADSSVRSSIEKIQINRRFAKKMDPVQISKINNNYTTSIQVGSKKLSEANAERSPPLPPPVGTDPEVAAGMMTRCPSHETGARASPSPPPLPPPPPPPPPPHMLLDELQNSFSSSQDTDSLSMQSDPDDLPLPPPPPPPPPPPIFPRTMSSSPMSAACDVNRTAPLLSKSRSLLAFLTPPSSSKNSLGCTINESRMNLSLANSTNSSSRSPTTATSTSNNNELIAEIAAKGKSTLKKTSPRPSGSVMMFTEKGMVPVTPASPPTATAVDQTAMSENSMMSPTNTTTPSTNEQTSKQAPVIPAAQQPPRLKVGSGKNTDDFSLKQASLAPKTEKNTLLEIEEKGKVVDKVDGGGGGTGNNKGKSGKGTPVKGKASEEVSEDFEEARKDSTSEVGAGKGETECLEEEEEEEEENNENKKEEEELEEEEEESRGLFAKPLPNNVNGKIESFLKMSQKGSFEKKRHNILSRISQDEVESDDPSSEESKRASEVEEKKKVNSSKKVQENSPKKTLGRNSPILQGNSTKKTLGRNSPILQENSAKKALGRNSPVLQENSAKKALGRNSPVLQENSAKKALGRNSPVLQENSAKKALGRNSPILQENSAKKSLGRNSPILQEYSTKKAFGRNSPIREGSPIGFLEKCSQQCSPKGSLDLSSTKSISEKVPLKTPESSPPKVLGNSSRAQGSSFPKISAKGPSIVQETSPIKSPGNGFLSSSKIIQEKDSSKLQESSLSRFPSTSPRIQEYGPKKFLDKGLPKVIDSSAKKYLERIPQRVQENSAKTLPESYPTKVQEKSPKMKPRASYINTFTQSYTSNYKSVRSVYSSEKRFTKQSSMSSETSTESKTPRFLDTSENTFTKDYSISSDISLDSKYLRSDLSEDLMVKDYSVSSETSIDSKHFKSDESETSYEDETDTDDMYCDMYYDLSRGRFHPVVNEIKYKAESLKKETYNFTKSFVNLNRGVYGDEEEDEEIEEDLEEPNSLDAFEMGRDSPQPAYARRNGDDRADRLVLEGEFDPKNFLDQVPDKDSGGRDIPPWKKHVLARQLAEKAKSDDEERKKQAEEERRYKNVPAWKRALMEKKSAEIKAAQAPKKEAKNVPPVAPKAVASRVVVNGEGNVKPPWQNDLKTK